LIYLFNNKIIKEMRIMASTPNKEEKVSGSSAKAPKTAENKPVKNSVKAPMVKASEKKSTASASDVKSGDTIKVHYTGSLDDGTVFDSSEKHDQPLQFVVGGGQIIKGFDTAVIGMKIGEEKKIRLEPKEAYGDVNPMLIRKFPKDKLPGDREMKPGMMLLMGLPNGQQMPVKITEVGKTEVTLDLNHPLAGKPLNFALKLVEIC
jgi:FKBP-type peptidyl-prolyl cis-trans isomerase 2